MRLAAPLCAAVLASAAGSAAWAACPPNAPIEQRVFGGGHCLVVETFGAASAGARPVLVVVVHGDISDGGAATYHAAFARTLARPGLVAVALTRPGYTDGQGRTSGGTTYDRRDNYTASNVAAVAGAIAALKRHYAPRRTVYVGHSGGAAIGGVILGRRPGLVDAAVLVSCPCDLARWRGDRGLDIWRHSLSPSLVVPRVPTATAVVALTGSADANTAPCLAQDYVRALARRGVDARFEPVDGAGHGFPGVAAAARAAVTRLAEP